MALRFQIFRFPVAMYPSFFLTAVLLGAGRWREPDLLVAWLCVVAVSVLWHELGHAVAFRCFGRDSAIELVALGGLTHDVSEKPLPAWQDIVVSAAGPAFGLVAAATVFAVLRLGPPPQSPVVRTLLLDLLWVNGAWSLLNLLPILPLDGGRVMYSTLRTRWNERAAAPAYAISLVVAVAATAFAVTGRWYFSALIAGSFAVSNGRALREYFRAKEAAAVGVEVATAEKALAEGALAEAGEAVQRASRVASRRELKDIVFTLDAVVKMRQGDRDGARAAIARMRAFEVSDELLAFLEKELTDAGMTKEATETARLRAERTTKVASTGQ